MLKFFRNMFNRVSLSRVHNPKKTINENENKDNYILDDALVKLGIGCRLKESNVNLNLFLKILGATNEIICDDQKTLEFMFDIKRRLDEPLIVKTDAFLEVDND